MRSFLRPDVLRSPGAGIASIALVLVLATSAGAPAGVRVAGDAMTMLPVGDVRLTAGPFHDAQQRDRDYLLELDPDRLLAGMRDAAGVPTEAKLYGGWERRGSGMIGHYLSACAWMSEATGDPELRRRVETIVAAMAECQDRAGSGGLYASRWEREHWFGPLARGELKLSNVLPWYVGHKTMNGLRDAWHVAGCARAKDVLIRYADWCAEVTSKLSDEQWREMVSREVGAPNEVFAELFERTGEPRYRTLAERFSRAGLRDALAGGNGSALAGRHANTEIPMFTGYERMAGAGCGGVWGKSARAFWNEVVERQSFAFGGNSIREAFISPDQRDAKLVDTCGPETCNSYNMLKLGRLLWEDDPEERTMAYIERVLFNHILATIAPPPATGFAYYTPTRPGHYRVFSRPRDAFWCCVGSGMENHGKHGSFLFAKADGRFAVNLYVPATARWPEQKARIHLDASATRRDVHELRLELEEPARFTLSLRRPGWVDTFRVRVNGGEVDASGAPYADIDRDWHDGDRVEVFLAPKLVAETTPGGRFASFRHGPFVLAAPLGRDGLDDDDFHAGGWRDFEQLGRKELDLAKVPGVARASIELLEEASTNGPVRYRLASDRGLIELRPFHEIGNERFSIYFPIR